MMAVRGVLKNPEEGHALIRSLLVGLEYLKKSRESAHYALVRLCLSQWLRRSNP
jgi:hypothetical protein